MFYGVILICLDPNAPSNGQNQSGPGGDFDSRGKSRRFEVSELVKLRRNIVEIGEPVSDVDELSQFGLFSVLIFLVKILSVIMYCMVRQAICKPA